MAACSLTALAVSGPVFAGPGQPRAAPFAWERLDGGLGPVACVRDVEHTTENKHASATLVTMMKGLPSCQKPVRHR